MTQARDPLPDPKIELVEVFRTGNAAVAAVARSLLEDAGIDYELRGDWDVPGIYKNPQGPAVLIVRQGDAAETTQLLAHLVEGLEPGPRSDDA